MYHEYNCAVYKEEYPPLRVSESHFEILIDAGNYVSIRVKKFLDHTLGSNFSSQIYLNKVAQKYANCFNSGTEVPIIFL